MKFNPIASTPQALSAQISRMFNKSIGIDNVSEDIVDGVTIWINNNQFQIKDDGITKDKINANVAGNGLGQNADGSLEIKNDGATYNNLAKAIYDLLWEVGSIRPWFSDTLPTYGTWLFLNGLTIGDGSSGATARANADVANLFAYIWNNMAQDQAILKPTSASDKTVTVDYADTVDSTAHGLALNDTVLAYSATTQPTPLATDNLYNAVNVSTDAFAFSEYGSGGAITNLTDVGVGALTVKKCTIAAGKSFTVDVSNTITCPAHGYANTNRVVFGTNGTYPTPLEIDRTYYVTNATTDTFTVALTSGGATVDITDLGVSSHFVIKITLAAGKTFTANASTDTITCTGHGYSDGDYVFLTAGTSLPAPLITNFLYMIFNVTANTFQLCLETNPWVAIDLTTAGSGTLTCYKATWETDKAISLSLTDFLNSTAHGYANTNKIYLTAATALPSPFVSTRVYYVVSAATNQFKLSLTSGGAAITIADLGTGALTCQKITEGTAINYTIPRSWRCASHGYSNNTAISLRSTTNLPTGFYCDKIYYVREATTNEFQLESSIGGGRISLTDAGSGTLKICATQARGASAAADFAAHYRLQLPDGRGKAFVGKDLLGGRSANRITGAWADLLGGSFGEENHALIEAELAVHQHVIKYTANTDGYTSGTTAVHLLTGARGSSSNTENAGSGTAHNTVQPSIVANWIIRY